MKRSKPSCFIFAANPSRKVCSLVMYCSVQSWWWWCWSRRTKARHHSHGESTADPLIPAVFSIKRDHPVCCCRELCWAKADREKLSRKITFNEQRSPTNQLQSITGSLAEAMDPRELLHASFRERVIGGCYPEKTHHGQSPFSLSPPGRDKCARPTGHADQTRRGFCSLVSDTKHGISHQPSGERNKAREHP
ncbi:hypothetical protein PGT21_007691 [Puccinia graminis f. sp. tritici]|uniref:Uncharacterized protein n=1 Tax=Puccinia graminis f. sp. tritici TaxID=56615 RepID=A0A5B0MMA0_PUCGR|nr:hypothetical protein PGT21_007691 [Puccinia graminis f. sp. tritici]